MTLNSIRLALASLMLLPAIASAKLTQTEINCIKTAVYHESKGEHATGQIAVAHTILNRKYSSWFPDNACRVVKQRAHGVWQFSWMNDYSKRKGFDLNYLAKQPHYDRVDSSVERAIDMYSAGNDVTGRALFFHSVNVSPNWKNYRRTKKVGRHIFYTKSDHKINASNLRKAVYKAKRTNEKVDSLDQWFAIKRYNSMEELLAQKSLL